MMKLLTYFLAIMVFTTPAMSEANKISILDDFVSSENLRWSFVTDQVMGGVSTGTFKIISNSQASFLQMKGNVSTENNGGFIQVRTSIGKSEAEKSKGVVLTLRGNSQAYFIHIRTNWTMLPWQYYQAEVFATDSWNTVRIPFSNFKSSSSVLPGKFGARNIRSIGIVAYGRNHEALIDISEIGLY